VTPVSDDNRLADELASLKIDREPKNGRGRSGDAPRRGVPGWLLAVALLALLGVGGYFVYQRGSGELFPDEVEIGSVTLMSPAQADVTLVASGYVYPRKKATVAPKTTGRLSRLLVAEGDHVKEGQLIAELEAGDPQAQLAQVRADVAAARARIEHARADLADAQARLAREEELLKRGAGTQSATDDARARATTARAQLGAAEAEERAVAARQAAVAVLLENTKVKAPFDGTVIRKLSEVGEVLSPLANVPGTGVVLLASLDDLEVQADVSESQFSKVKVGTPAEILLDAFADRRFRGQVAEIRQQVDRAKASVTVKVRFSDPPVGVLPDMAAKVSFLTKALDQAALKAAPKIVVTADAVVERGGRKVVFVLDDNRVRERAVTVAPGEAVAGMVELISGVAPGTRVVRHPDSKLRDGSPIKEKKK